MLKKILILLILIIIAIFAGDYTNKNNSVPSDVIQETPAQNNASPTPTGKITDSKSMSFGATVDSASYRYPGHWYGPVDEEGSKKEIDIIADMGMDFFRIDVRNETLGFPDEVKKLDNIIAYGRSKNLKLYIGIYGMETWLASFEKIITLYRKGGGGKASLDEFKKMYTEQTMYLMDRYKPNYIMIMPDARQNIGNQVDSVRPVTEWVAYTKELAAKIKSISPGTKIILNEVIRSEDSLSSVDYVEGVMKDNDTNIDVIAIDPYDFNELNDEISTSSRLKKQYKWHGELWVGETNVFNSKGEDYQKRYFETAIDLAKENGFTGYVVFYLRDMPVTKAERGIIRNDFSKKPAYWLIKAKIQEIQNTTAD